MVGEVPRCRIKLGRQAFYGYPGGALPVAEFQFELAYYKRSHVFSVKLIADVDSGEGGKLR